MAEGAAPSDGHCHGDFLPNLGQDNKAQEMQPREALQDAHGREEDTPIMDRPPSSSTKSLGKAIQAYDQEHDGAASSTKLIPKANADNMTHMDDSLKSRPVPKKSQPPQIPSYLNETRGHSPSGDEGLEHDPQASNYGHDDNTQTGVVSTNRSFGVVRDGITSPCGGELAKDGAPTMKSLGKAIQDGITSPCVVELTKGTIAASSSMKSISRVDPKTEENVNSLGGSSSWTLSPPKAVQDVLGSAEHTLDVGRPPSSWTKSRDKAIEAYDQEHNRAASSTKIIPKANADAGISIQAPAQHQDEVVAAIGGPTHPNATSVASNVAPAIPAFAQHDVNVAIAAIGGAGAGLAAAQGNVARQVPAPAQINGRGIVVVAARPAPAAIPVPVLPPNPGVNNIDLLTNSSIRLLRNPTDGDEGKIWDKLN